MRRIGLGVLLAVALAGPGFAVGLTDTRMAVVYADFGSNVFLGPGQVTPFFDPATIPFVPGSSTPNGHNSVPHQFVLGDVNAVIGAQIPFTQEAGGAQTAPYQVTSQSLTFRDPETGAQLSTFSMPSGAYLNILQAHGEAPDLGIDGLFPILEDVSMAYRTGTEGHPLTGFLLNLRVTLLSNLVEDPQPGAVQQLVDEVDPFMQIDTTAYDNGPWGWVSGLFSVDMFVEGAISTGQPGPKLPTALYFYQSTEDPSVVAVVGPPASISGFVGVNVFAPEPGTSLLLILFGIGWLFGRQHLRR